MKKIDKIIDAIQEAINGLDCDGYSTSNRQLYIQEGMREALEIVEGME